MIRLLVRRLFVVFLVLCGLIAASSFWWEHMADLFGDQAHQGQLPTKTQESLCYRVPRKGWLDFALPSWTDRLKIVSNAELPDQVDIKPEATLHYALAYRVLDTAGEVIQAGVYHHTTGLTPYIYQPTQEEIDILAYAESQFQPADSKQIRLNLRPLLRKRRAARLRLKLYQADKPLQGAVVRVYHPEYHSEREVSYLWHRLPEKRKRDLAEGNVYPAQFLTSKEQRNLVRSMWRPTAPQGMEGRDYELQRLFRLQTDQAVPQRPEPVAPQGLMIWPGHRATIPVPEQGRRLRVVVRNQRSEGRGQKTEGKRVQAQDREAKLGIRWFGRGMGETRETVLSVDETPQTYTASYPGGLIELRATARVSAEVQVLTESGPSRVEPEGMYLRTYQPSSDMPVEYAVSNVQGQMTPFRLDCRCLVPQGFSGGNATAQVDYTLQTKTGQNKNGSLQITSPVSLYDRIQRKEGNMTVSDPVSRYFLLPETISKVRISSPDQVLISAYTRPPGLAKTTRVPDAYYAASRSEEGQPTWFLLFPTQKDKLYTRHQSHLLNLQYRPPKRDPRLEQGRYRWDAFRPSGTWSGAYLFTPRQTREPVRKQALAAAYTQIDLNKTQSVVFGSPQGQRTLQPELVYLGGTGEGQALRVFVNGELRVQRPLVGARGRISLPPVARGENRIRVQTQADIRVYMNQVLSQPADHILRFANRLSAEGLRFTYRKQVSGPETLSLKLFTPKEASSRSTKVRVRLLSPPTREVGPFAGFTVFERIFQIRPPQSAIQVPVMQTEEEYVTAGQPFFVPLNQDLPSGSYQIRVDLQDGPGGYVQMYRILPGKWDEREITKEPVVGKE